MGKLFFLHLMIGHKNLRENVAPKGSGKFWKFDEYIKMHQKGMKFGETSYDFFGSCAINFELIRPR